MQVLNNYQINSTAFTGEIILKGPWPDKLKKAFLASSNVQQLAGSESDVVARVKVHVVDKKEAYNNMNHTLGEKLYRINISFVDNNWRSRLADFFKLLPRKRVTSNYHREKSLIERLETDINDRFFSRFYQ